MTDTTPPEVPAVLIPVSLVTLWQAVQVMPATRSWYEAAAPVVLAHYGGAIDHDGYWALTVEEFTRYAAAAGIDVDDRPAFD